jgi:hypothetical protein
VHRVIAVLLVAAVVVPVRALACGLTPPIGPSGLPMTCRGDGPRLRVGLTAGGTSTTIAFGDARDDLVQGATAATFDVQPVEGLTLGVSAGASVWGRIDHLGVPHGLKPGPIGGVGIAYRIPALPLFVQPSFSYSLARSTSRAPDGAEAAFTARDWRAGLVIGKAIGSTWVPFAVARVFGAGTEWSVAGGHGADAHRFHAGIGSAFGFDRFDVVSELAFLGEKRASVGVGYSF